MPNLARRLLGLKGIAAAFVFVAFGIGTGVSIAQAQPSATAAAAGVVVSESGQIGPVYGHTLHIGRSTANDVRRAEGRKPNSDMPVMGRTGVVGRTLEYRIGKGKSACRREYGFSAGSPRLSDFESTCRDTRTGTGTRFGMTPRQVQGHQFALGEFSPPLGHDCSLEASAVATETGNIWLVVWMKGNTGQGKLDTPNMVKSIAIYADNAVFFRSACE